MENFASNTKFRTSEVKMTAKTSPVQSIHQITPLRKFVSCDNTNQNTPDKITPSKDKIVVVAKTI